MLTRTLSAVTLIALLQFPNAAVAKIKIAASINDLASIASSVGGDRVECFAIAKPKSDVHRVDAQSDSVVTNDDTALMCARVPASRAPQGVLESHDDTNVCRAP